MSDWESEDLPEVMDTRFVAAMTRQSLTGYVEAARASSRFLEFLVDHQPHPSPDARHASVRDGLEDHARWAPAAATDVEETVALLTGPPGPANASELIARLVRRSHDAGQHLAVAIGMIDPLPEFFTADKPTDDPDV